MVNKNWEDFSTVYLLYDFFADANGEWAVLRETYLS